jgi:hypothetical protein
LVERLQESNESHLILVEYKSGHSVNEEWVYNEADIPNAKIVWGRFSSPELNHHLVKSYPNRKVWRLAVPSGSIEPYVPESQEGLANDTTVDASSSSPATL